MIKKKVFIIILVIISFLVFIYFIQSSNQVKFVVRDIHMDFKGVVIKKYSVRKGVEPTYLKVKTESNEIDIIPSYEIVDFANVGDSIVKLKDENICYVIKRIGGKRKFFYTDISMEQRNNNKFPKEWKNKWMESSAWDTLN